jgi:hypothetical protein
MVKVPGGGREHNDNDIRRAQVRVREMLAREFSRFQRGSRRHRPGRSCEGVQESPGDKRG